MREPLGRARVAPVAERAHQLLGRQRRSATHEPCGRRSGRGRSGRGPGPPSVLVTDSIVVMRTPGSSRWVAVVGVDVDRAQDLPQGDRPLRRRGSTRRRSGRAGRRRRRRTAARSSGCASRLARVHARAANRFDWDPRWSTITSRATSWSRRGCGDVGERLVDLVEEVAGPLRRRTGAARQDLADDHLDLGHGPALAAPCAWRG